MALVHVDTDIGGDPDDLCATRPRAVRLTLPAAYCAPLLFLRGIRRHLVVAGREFPRSLIAAVCSLGSILEDHFPSESGATRRSSRAFARS